MAPSMEKSTLVRLCPTKSAGFQSGNVTTSLKRLVGAKTVIGKSKLYVTEPALAVPSATDTSKIGSNQNVRTFIDILLDSDFQNSIGDDAHQNSGVHHSLPVQIKIGRAHV